MSRIIRFLAGVLAAAVVVEQASAFSFWGPLEGWQTSDLSYPEEDDLGASKNLAHGFRVTSPILTYGFDAEFLNYFGQDGVKAVDAAMKLLNELPSASRMSPELTEFLTEGNTRVNERAKASRLLDLKSSMLVIMMEHLGLAGEKHVFDLRHRIGGGGCVFNYMVIVRNFDPIYPYPYSHYVNGVLYTWKIIDGCPVVNVANAVEQAVDSTQTPFTAVASGIKHGNYFLGLTRDDAGGLRYLYRQSNVALEGLPIGSTLGMVNNKSTASPWGPVVNPYATNSFTNGVVTNILVNTNTVFWRGGVEKITFVKMKFNSATGTNNYVTPLSYTVPAIVSNRWVNQSVRRAINQPDILISATDLMGAWYRRSYSHLGAGTGNAATNSLAGPGVINPQMTIEFNSIGEHSYIVELANNYFLDSTADPDLNSDEPYSTPGYRWGSFDGSTNDPIVYPNGSHIRELERQLLLGQ